VDTAALYQIKIQGRIDYKWSAWFEEMTIVSQSDGTTLLTGSMKDQAALHGVLARIRDLNLVLISVTRASE
jgi:hypothetical protein